MSCYSRILGYVYIKRGCNKSQYNGSRIDAEMDRVSCWIDHAIDLVQSNRFYEWANNLIWLTR